MTLGGIVRNRMSAAALITALVALVVATSPWFGYRVSALFSRFSGNPLERPIRQLAATPDRFDGALVFIVGFCQNTFENVTIHDSANGSPWHGSIWLVLSEAQAEAIHASTPKACRVTGIFREGPGGHLGNSIGEVRPVTEIALYPEPDAA
jgi:hypothetical protein